MSETGCDACRGVGPLLVAPGTSGRRWQCGRCRTTWSHADPAKPWEPRTPAIPTLLDRAGSYARDAAALRADGRADAAVVYETVAAELRQVAEEVGK
jgi:hypothetical protein